MSNTSRTVRHLRLRAARESAIHRAALLLEDALRTASLPDASGRIVLVRRLALGRIDSRAAPQTLALDLERAVARLTPECVYAGAADADQAPAVWFRDALDAHVRLALRLAAGGPADAWYWPLAVPGWRRHTPLLQALRQIVFSLAAFPEAPAALPLWAAAMAGAGHAWRLIAALRVEDVEPLAHAAAVRVPALAGTDLRPPRATPGPGTDSHATRGARATSASTVPAAAGPSTQRQVQGMDPRLELVRALLGAAGAPAVRVDAQSAAPALPGSPQSRYGAVRAAGEGIIGRHPRPPGRGKRPAGERPEGRFASEEPEERGRADRRSNAPAAPATATEMRPAPGAMASGPTQVRHWDGPANGQTRTVPPLRAQDGDGAGSAPALPWAALDTITRAGGLLFLIPVLERLGYRDWLENQGEWARCDVAHRVLALALTRLQIPDEDPAWRLAIHRGGRPAPRRFVAPAPWRKEPCSRDGGLRVTECDGTRTLWDASGRLLLGAWRGRCPRALTRDWRRATPHAGGRHQPYDADLVTGAWLLAARRWLRRVAGIGLWDLALRPAALALTPTHADLWFEMGVAELRIRRAGLDIDPGWVPWYGRVVTFRYHR